MFNALLSTLALLAPAAPAHSAEDARASEPDHVVVVVFENKPLTKLIGNPHARYLNQLAASSAVFTESRALVHPSQPNYLALFSGSMQGVEDDDCIEEFFDGPNLGRQLLDSGRGFIGYAEDLPFTGYLGCEYDGYTSRHNPWVNFSNLPEEVNRPLTDFPIDYSQLPKLSFVIPNLCNDMHDCGIRVGDDWLETSLDGYAQWARANNSLLVVTFDEDNGLEDNRILTMISGADVLPGEYTQPIDHYTLLATMEGWFGLPPLGEAANRSPITGIWQETPA